MTEVQFNTDDESKKYILSLFNKKVDAEGKVIDATTGEAVMSVDERQVTLENFGAIEMVDGRAVFVICDIVSIMAFQAKYRKDQL